MLLNHSINHKVNTMLSTKQIGAKIGGIKRSAGTLRANVQTVLMHTSAHVFEHGDCTLFNRLLAASVGVNKGKLIAYAEKFGYVTYKGGEFKTNKKARKASIEAEEYKNGDALISYLEHQPQWHEDFITPEGVESDTNVIVPDLDVTKRIENLSKAVKSAKGKVLDAGLVKALKDLSEALNVAHGAVAKAA
jgi:hypothetical protein